MSDQPNQDGIQPTLTEGQRATLDYAQRRGYKLDEARVESRVKQSRTEADVADRQAAARAEARRLGFLPEVQEGE